MERRHGVFLRGFTSRPNARDERGAAAVEFALVLPLLLLVVFGVVTYGLIFTAQISLNSAARDGARAGVVQPLGGTALTCSTIATMARGSSATLGVNSTAVGVTVTGPTGTTCSLAKNAGSVTGAGASSTVCTGSSAGGQVSVVLSYTASSPVPLVPPQSVNLTGKGKFVCEYS